MKGQECFCFASNHFQAQCRFKNTKWHNYGVVRDISRKCLKSKEKDVKIFLQNSTHLIEGERVVNENEQFDYLYHIYRNANEKSRSVLTEVTKNGHSTELELDTGTSLIVIDTKTFENGLKEAKMTDSGVKFKTFWGKY